MSTVEFMSRFPAQAIMEIMSSHVVMNPERSLSQIGPRLSITTAHSSNAVAACNAANVHNVARIERAVRYCLSPALNIRGRAVAVQVLHDRMTECEYSRMVEGRMKGDLIFPCFSLQSSSSTRQ